MAIRVHGGVITDQTLTGSLRFFELAATDLGLNAIGSVGQVVAASTNTAAGVGTGSGYSVGDDLTVVGGTFTTAAVLEVLTVDGGGGVTSVRVDDLGDSVRGAYSVLPTNPVATTGGLGSGAEFVLDFSSTIIIPNASLTEREFYVSFGKPVTGSAADQALSVVAQRANIVQIILVNDDTVQFVAENTGYGWSYTAGAELSFTSLAFADANPDTIVRTGGADLTLTFSAGDIVRIANAEDPANDGDYEIATVNSTTIVLTAAAALTANTADTTATLSLVTDELRDAIRALGAAVAVPDTTDTGTTIDLTAVTVDELFITDGISNP